MRNTTIYRFKGRTVTIYNCCYITTGKEIREVTKRRIDSERGKMEIKALCQTLSKVRYVQRDCKRFTGMAKSGRPIVRAKGKIISRAFLTKAILAIRDKIKRIEMFPNLPVMDRFENFRKNEG